MSASDPFWQGDREREAGLPVSRLCDRHDIDVGASQLSFLQHVVRPSFQALQLLAPQTATVALRCIEAAEVLSSCLYRAPPTRSPPRVITTCISPACVQRAAQTMTKAMIAERSVISTSEHPLKPSMSLKWFTSGLRSTGV